MAYKNREESIELKIMRILNARMELSKNDKQHYLNLKKGFEGEIQFDQLIEGVGLDKKFYILNDLLLKSVNSTLQIDTTIITQKLIIPCEIKNFDGNYFYQDKNFYSCLTGQAIQNPLEQLNRKKILLSKLLYKNGFNISIEGHLVFISPEFLLYQASLNQPIVFYTQLNAFLRALHTKPANLNDAHKSLADFLVKAHMIAPLSTQIPTYEFGSLRKGPVCGCCHSHLVEVHGRKLVCSDCGYIEKIEKAVVRSVEELKLLFPQMKITANLVFDWCNLSISQKWLRKILKENYKTIGLGKGTYYV